MRTLPLLFVVLLAGPIVSCSSADKGGGSIDNGDGSVGTDSGLGSDSNVPYDTSPSDGLTGDIKPTDAPPEGTSIVYAHTDVDLYSLDVKTNAVTKIGTFTGGTGAITDLAVDGSDNVFVNSESAIYAAALPAGGTGPVNLTLKTPLTAGTKFVALGFTTKGTLTANEDLIAGDTAGDLYFVDTTSGATQNLGSFGNWLASDPNPSGKSTTSDKWTLSGDVVFYNDATGAPRGLATVRTCYTSGTPPTAKCYASNDALAEIDMAALKSNYTSKGTSASLRKQILGVSGTGRLFGLGAWGDTVYGFSRYNKGGTGGAPALPPELVTMGSSGVGTVIKQFGTGAAPDFTDGWSGAGVTTKAKVTVIK